MPIGVVLWTTGHVARFAGRAVLDDPELDLVGCYAHSPAKVGRDIGELIGTAPTGVMATDDVEALLALAPDVVAYYPILRVDQIPQHTELLCRFLRAGINVVTTSNVVTGRWWKAGKPSTKPDEPAVPPSTGVASTRASSTPWP